MIMQLLQELSDLGLFWLKSVYKRLYEVKHYSN